MNASKPRQKHTYDCGGEEAETQMAGSREIDN